MVGHLSSLMAQFPLWFHLASHLASSSFAEARGSSAVLPVDDGSGGALLLIRSMPTHRQLLPVFLLLGLFFHSSASSLSSFFSVTSPSCEFQLAIDYFALYSAPTYWRFFDILIKRRCRVYQRLVPACVLCIERT